MKRHYRYILFLIILLPALTLAGCFKTADQSATKLVKDKEFNMIVATDIHYLEPSLHDNGKAFQDFTASGGSRMLPYSDELTDAFISNVIRQKPVALILSGDLTNNGEKKSHVELAHKLATVKKAGIPVFVIPGNHDVSNPWARSFKGDHQYVTDYISPTDFSSIYNDFGYSSAISRDTGSLSYLAPLSSDLWLLMLDSCQYDNNEDYGSPQGDGRVKEETLAWIDEASKLAAERHAHVIAVMHHNLIDHTSIPRDGYTVNNHEEVMADLVKNNISLVLSGHIHIQDIRSENTVTDIASSALSVYPHQYGVLHFSARDATIAYNTEQTDVESWSKEQKIVNPDLNQFRDYAKDFFYQDSYKKAYSSFQDSNYPEKDRQAMSKAMAELNLYYFSGSTAEIGADLLNSEGVTLWKKAQDIRMKKYVLSMIDSSKRVNNHLTLKLK
ncbi:metallophosphoesterase [Gorillibacterium massiliense]|uniref:metallophosphoesterase n=1 Tax=Gorillibacterium massiliense TaxID=1280390 RepID=UPI0004BAFA08|nr:metallophosphoesterase [Gorillibacterium massiliense]